LYDPRIREPSVAAMSVWRLNTASIDNGPAITTQAHRIDPPATVTRIRRRMCPWWPFEAFSTVCQGREPLEQGSPAVRPIAFAVASLVAIALTSPTQASQRTLPWPKPSDSGLAMQSPMAEVPYMAQVQFSEPYPAPDEVFVSEAPTEFEVFGDGSPEHCLECGPVAPRRKWCPCLTGMWSTLKDWCSLSALRRKPRCAPTCQPVASCGQPQMPVSSCCQQQSIEANYLPHPPAASCCPPPACEPPRQCWLARVIGRLPWRRRLDMSPHACVGEVTIGGPDVYWTPQPYESYETYPMDPVPMEGPFEMPLPEPAGEQG
jgi:hypothetical protein